MKSYCLNIAGYVIQIESGTNGPDLVPSVRFQNNICRGHVSDITLRVHSCLCTVPEGIERVFHAPYVEEVNGSRIVKGEEFWTVYKHRSDIYINTIFPLSDSGKRGWLKFSLAYREWDLWVENAGQSFDPLEYPIDGLILYYLSVIHGDIFIHASGINISNHGYLFSGISGKGKSTMAKLWETAGAKVIHDDRLIIRHSSGPYKMHNTPVYDNDTPSASPLTKIFLIEHGTENRFSPVSGANAASMVMANCIQHNWNPEIIARLMGSVSIMCSMVPCIRLSFKPDRNIVDFLLEYE